MSEPVAPTPIKHSPIAPAEPTTIRDGWEISTRRSTAALTLTDCTPLAKYQVRAPVSGHAAAELGVRFGRAFRGEDGILVVGSGPGEWLLVGPPDSGKTITARLQDIAARASPELVTFVDHTHGRALMKITGSSAAAVLAKVCGVDLSEDITPDGAALRSSVAAVATDIVRNDQSGMPSYLLHCERSSGQYLFDALLEAGADLCIEIVGFTTSEIC